METGHRCRGLKRSGGPGLRGKHTSGSRGFTNADAVDYVHVNSSHANRLRANRGADAIAYSHVVPVTVEHAVTDTQSAAHRNGPAN